MKKILFVCLGNICRSPLAHGIAESLIEQQALPFEVDSAGTGSWHIGESPCSNSIKVAKLYGIDISHQRARQVKKEDFTHFDYIIALDQKNFHDLQQLGCPNLFKLGNYGYHGEDVPDPYFFNGFDGFEKVYSMIETCVKNFLQQHSE